VEYTFPENKAGIKYKLIVHPGANPDVVKMHYTGDVKEIKKDSSGNILIETPAGTITDHAPKSFYEEDNKILPSAFTLNENIISCSCLK
jgi:hypothetical protein